MINLRTFLGSLVVIIGIMVITFSADKAQAMTSRTIFEPVYVGSKQSNLIYVVNKSDGFGFSNVDNKYQINHVVMTAFDPNTGDLLDEREISVIEPGKGVSQVLTDTFPQAHPSLVVVLVDFTHINGNEVLDIHNTNELPFIVTSLLVNRKHATILQVKGVTELLNDGSTTGE